ncbi:MAG TPA: hypothetical protein VFD70_18490 [Anaerolineae bacterium]|nr:hypothetical protein [Anaerolineae bacterium]
MTHPRTPQSDYLLALGKKILQPYTELPNTRAAMITGSVAEGISDFYSDLDMTVYYADELPGDEELTRIHQANGAPQRAWLLGERAEGAIVEAYELNGVQAQIGHITLAAWEQELAEVLEKFNADTPLHKAMSGTLESITVYGDDYMNAWKQKIAAYPDELARAMVEKHLQFFPYWNIQNQLAARDALIWHYQILTESAYNLLAILAGINRLYFTTFQFKKMRRFINQLKIAPPNLADRLEKLFSQEPAKAAVSLEELVSQIITLVEQTMPAVDASAVKSRLGKRRPPWQYESLR